MALPKIDLPLYELVLPSSGEKIKYRPFTVKEEKILLVAQESDEIAQQVIATKQIVNNCLIDVDVSDLPMFDLEYILLNLRARSIDNKIEFGITDPETQEAVKLELDIDKIEVIKEETHSNKVRVNDEYYLFLKYPTIDEFIKIADISENDPLANYFIMVSCLDKLASEEDVFDFKNYTDDEIDEFMEGMDAEVIKGIQTFFETIPKLRHELHYTNSNGDEKTFVIEGMRTFFI